MLIPKMIQTLEPYKPGKPIEETKREFNLKEVVKLASNESPLGPSEHVKKAIHKAVEDLHRYPDASSYELKKAYSRYTGWPEDGIVFGNGSNEIMDFLIRLVCVPGDEIVTSQYAFIAYKISAQAAQVHTREAKVDSELRIDLKNVAKEINQSNKVKIVFLPNPNNPTGTYFNNTEWEAFMKEFGNRDNLFIVLDEAYDEYVRATDCPKGITNLPKYKNLFLLRTFSKVFGLGGLRVGALLGHPEWIQYIHRIRNPFNVNSIAQVAATAAIEDEAYRKKILQLTWDGMDWLEPRLQKIVPKVYSSQGNFLLVDIGRDSAEIYNNLLKEGVILRPVRNYGLMNHLRISIGLPEENEKALSALTKVLT